MSDPNSETTLVLIKPDGVQRGLIGEILSRFERTGLKIVGLKLLHADDDLASRHYAAHLGKPFYEGLKKFIISAPLVAIALRGRSAVGHIRNLMGATDPAQAAPGTVRGDMGVDIGRNLVHGSATVEEAQTEVALFFGDAELLNYERSNDGWISES